MEVFQIEKNIRGLLVVATVSPLVGVLGTIQGLVGFYSQPGVLEGKAPSLAMSDAVYQALLSSALGLSIAIPAYLFYSYLASRSRQIVHSWNGPARRPFAWCVMPGRGARPERA